MTIESKCSEDGCSRPAYALLLCAPHYRRLRRRAAGDLAKPVRSRAAAGEQVTIGVRVTRDVADELGQRFDTITTGAREVLLSWYARLR